MRRIVSVLLTLTIIFSFASVSSADTVPTADASNVIINENFDGGSLHPSGNGMYVANSGHIGAGKYSFENSGERLLYNGGTEISGGVLKYEEKVKITQSGSATLLMASDTNGVNNAFSITIDPSYIRYNAYDSTGNSAGGNISAYDLNTEYDIAAYVDLDSGLLQIELNGKSVCGGTKLYINKNNRSGNINRIFDIKTNSAQFELYGVSVKRIAKLPYDKTEEVLWYEDFSDFDRETCGSKTEVPDDNILTSDSAEHGNVLHIGQGVRLHKPVSVSGEFSVKTDLYFTTESIWTNIFKILGASDAETAYLKVENKNLKIYAGADSSAEACTGNLVETVEANKWYTVEISGNASTREISVYVNGVKKCDGIYLLNNGAVQEPFYIDNKYAGTVANGIYIDNCEIGLTADYKADNVFEDVKVDTDISSDDTVNIAFSNVVSAPVTANGYVTFKNGNRALKDLNLASGVYAFNTDIRVPQYGADDATNTLWDAYRSNTPSYGVQTIGKNIFVYANDANGNTVKRNIVENYSTSAWYNIQIITNTSNNRIRVFVNGIECAADTEMYLKGDGAITRPYNFDARYNAADFVYDVRSIKLYEDKLLGALGIQNGILSGNLTLPTSVTVDGITYSVTWSTSDSSVIKADGSVTVDVSSAKFPVIQAFVSDNDSVKATRRYTFYAPPGELDFEDKTNVTENINDMPFVTSDGKLITWTSSHPEIVTATGAVTRPADTTVVTLTASYGDTVKQYSIQVIGMNEENKVFVLENDFYTGGEKMIGKVQITDNTVEYRTKIYNATESSIKAAMIIGVYDSENTLVDIKNGSIQDVASHSYGNEEKLTCVLPDDGQYRIEGFLWEPYTLSPYCKACSAGDKDAMLYVIGSSSYSSYSQNAAQDQAGIGMYMGKYLSENITVENAAYGGKSSRSYLCLDDSKAHFEKILNNLKDGDYMQISFGANEAGEGIRYVTPEEFPDYLSVYVSAAKDRGAVAYLVTQPFNGKYIPATYDAAASIESNSSTEARRAAMRTFANDNGLILVDLSAKQEEYYSTLTADEIRNLYIYEYDSDGTQNDYLQHLNKSSADMVAKMLMQLIGQSGINGLSGAVRTAD